LQQPNTQSPLNLNQQTFSDTTPILNAIHFQLPTHEHSMISLTAEEAQSRFNVPIAIEHFPSASTTAEESHVRTVLQNMCIAYSPRQNTGAASVAHLCAQPNTFTTPSTFPTAHTAEQYAESHSHVMACLPDLHIVSFQLVNVKEM
jgi:hypothetical protein